MTTVRLPPWVVVERGTAPILLLAPHGGRRHDVRVPGAHKVNDLHTADVTRELARLLGASAVLNERVDRNQLDLNRVSQVRREAPWLLELVAELLGEMIATAGRATVLVVHGWNVSQVACDVGIGMREGVEGLGAVRPGSATVAADFVRERLRPLQRNAAAAEILVTIGSRYPAAHPNNLLQLFRAESDAECPVAGICRTATVDAAQLELAIPLRWPGARRDRFVRLLADTFRSFPDAAAVSPTSLPPVWRTGAGRVTRRRGWQLVADDLLLMASVDAGDDGAIAGRVVVSEHADRLALFTGELVDGARAWTIPPLECECGPTGVDRVRYAGPVVAFPRHTPFVDLEHGLADGHVVEARLDVRFARDPVDAPSGNAPCFGDVTGELVIDERRYVLATRGAATHADAPVRPVFPDCRVTLPLLPLGGVRLARGPRATAEDGRDGMSAVLVGSIRRDGVDLPIAADVEVRLARNCGSVTIACRGPDGWSARWDGNLERVIPVRRPGPAGSVVETTFALVRVDGRAVGWLETSVVAAPPRLTAN